LGKAGFGKYEKGGATFLSCFFFKKKKKDPFQPVPEKCFLLMGLFKYSNLMTN